MRRRGGGDSEKVGGLGGCLSSREVEDRSRQMVHSGANNIAIASTHLSAARKIKFETRRPLFTRANPQQKKGRTDKSSQRRCCVDAKRQCNAKRNEMQQRFRSLSLGAESKDPGRLARSKVTGNSKGNKMNRRATPEVTFSRGEGKKKEIPTIRRPRWIHLRSLLYARISISQAPQVSFREEKDWSQVKKRHGAGGILRTSDSGGSSDFWCAFSTLARVGRGRPATIVAKETITFSSQPDDQTRVII